LQIRVNSQGIIEEAVFKTFGCGSAIASSSLATEWVKGKHVNENNSYHTNCYNSSWSGSESESS
jgi:nitrogen fixation NifU-like protein